ncbi:BRE1 E3 ubiquitin ligase-domain-containing protein [Dendryphion nanum]|uniref:E3 ubiquitin protein ligase n=1 Tax=Dendryphion nanum TaxID=256645 RepID=A0A9P9DPC7_9PLEO|nr:BRE1 E3 ubiquitin ligase-domain-containing protein [Dendryphion nanum]
MVAEKKIDRIKSAQVQKLEKQAIAGGVKEESSATNNGPESTNGVASGVINEELETARDAALAEASKRKEQLDQLEADNKKLTEEVTSLNVKLTGLSDDDYAKTDLFKAIKSQHEDVIKRVNNLEAINIQLREEAQKFQAERTAYRIKIDDEARATVSENEGSVARAEADLARIRHSRDELLAKISVLEASQKNNDASRDQTKELVSACENRIAALESECQRLRLQLEQNAAEVQSTPALDALSPEELRQKIMTLESQYKLLSNELPSMEAAWKKAQAVAGKKITEITTWEDNITRANADKTKADQKFFAAMKAKETLEQQIRALRTQAIKSTEIVTQLKDADHASRSLVEKLEKQTAEMKAQMDELSIQHRTLQQKLNEGAITSDGQVSQIAELKKVLEAKDTAYLAAKHAQRESEAERDKLKAEVKGLEKQCDHWKQKSLGDQSDEASMMQTMLQCQVCKNNFKDTILKNCGHIFCNSCVQDRLINRARKCPNCSKAFGANDTMRVHL